MGAAAVGCPVEITGGIDSEITAGTGGDHVRTLDVVQGLKGPAAASVREFEDRTVISRAARGGRSEQIAGAVEDQTAHRKQSVKYESQSQRPNPFSKLLGRSGRLAGRCDWLRGRHSWRGHGLAPLARRVCPDALSIALNANC